MTTLAEIPVVRSDRQKALEAYRHYKRLMTEGRATTEDRIIMMGQRALSKGQAIINVRDAIGRGGLTEKNWPRLAIARADWTQVWCRIHARYGEVDFHANEWRGGRKAYAYRRLQWTYYGGGESLKLRAIVPVIPPLARPPQRYLHKFSILFEADWQAAPVDPYLLKHLHGDLYAILAAWNLTEVERAVLSQTRRA